ncbi:MAG: hypothetical protein HS111_28705 [Kofleriaceae bacterium]|nr:hypothetical protein [Kofleriaceae bacterium]
MRSIYSFGGGVALTLALLLACSDDSPGDADAAACNCEPPLAGRIVQVERLRTDLSGTLVGAFAECAPSSRLLGGGCEVRGQNAETLVLNQAGINTNPLAYGCEWQNPSSITVETVRAWAICLNP